MSSEYYHKFSKIHDLLKSYGCKATYDFMPEYEEPPIFGGFNFYKPESEMHTDEHRKEWDEKSDAELDVVVPTKWDKASKGQIRFDINYSSRVNLYSMYISLPTSGRSISLSLKTYKNQEDVIAEISKWLKAAKCKPVKTSRRQKKTVKFGEQLSLF